MDGKRTYGQLEADWNLKWSCVKKKVSEIHHRISKLPVVELPLGASNEAIWERDANHKKAYADRLILLDFLYADLHQFLVLVESMDRKKIS